MKKIYIILSILIFASCDEYLDIVPDDVATIEHAFTDRISAERFMATIYSYMPRIGDLSADPAILASDEYGVVEDAYYVSSVGYLGNRIKLGHQNANDPLLNYWEGSQRGRGLFRALRDCNIFFENIDKVGPDLPDDERERWIAEVTFFKAFYHYYMLRLYGPIPLVRENLPIATGINGVKVHRDPFDECIKYIVQLLDESIEGLPLNVINISSELGRITKPIAAAIKAEVLVMAASPLFNGNEDFGTLTDNRGIKLFNGREDSTKWSKAAAACKEAIDICHDANIRRLYTFNDSRFPLSDETRRLMSIRGVATIKWNEELIWGNPVNTSGDLQKRGLPFLKAEDRLGNGPVGEVYADFSMAELFYSQNGVPINEDVAYDYDGRYETATMGSDHYYYIKEGLVTAKLNMYREPRFYANLGFDTGYWFGNGRTKDVGQGNDTETAWSLKMKAGEMSGKSGDIRYSRSGYYVKKATNFETSTTSTGSMTTTRYTYPIMRLADLYLLDAEALNESLEAPTPEVYHYVDMVRERAGLPGVVESWRDWSNVPNKPLSKAGMQEIIRRERMIELCFESKRFWDIRRWKLGHIYFNRPEIGWNANGNSTETYYTITTYNQLEFRTREYLWPIREAELRKNINLVQNPYWN
jgi:hypothetical protein